MTEETAPTRDELMEQLYSRLRQPRDKAGQDVNWLLVEVAQDARNTLEQSEIDIVTWELSLERQTAELEDESSSGYNLEERREALEQSAQALRQAQADAQARYDARRRIFAEMLQEVRESRRVLLAQETLDEIQLLNEGNFLGFELGMDQKRFDAYFGANPMYQQPTAGLTELDRARSEGIDYSRAPEPAAEPVPTRERKIFRELIEPVPQLAREQGASSRGSIAPTSTKRASVRHAESVIPEPEREVDAELDY